jgi:branched-chain amino acid transport system permease protein
LLTEFLKRLSTRPDLPARAPVVLQSIVYAAILILIMLFLPPGLLPGLIQLARRLIARLRGARASDTGQNQTPIGELADG